MRKVKAFIFKLIRPLFVDDLDVNEEFNCVVCGTSVLRRKLLCRSCTKAGRAIEDGVAFVRPRKNGL
jgi:hypothetical protein